MPNHNVKETVILCSVCGGQNQGIAKFCVNCRSPLSLDQRMTAREAEKIQSERSRLRSRSRKFRRFLIAHSLTGLLLASGFFIYSENSDLETPLSDIGAVSEQGSWPMYQGGPSLNGLSVDPQMSGPETSDKETLWVFDTEDGISGSPSVAGGILYFSTKRNQILALEASSGAIIWEFPTEAASDSVPAIAGDLVFSALKEGRLVALDRYDGSLVWDFKTSEPFFSSPNVFNGVLYVGSSDKSVYAFDATNGEMRWRYKAGSRVTTTLAANDEIVAFTAQDNMVRIIDAKTGEFRLDYPTDASGGTVSLDGKRLFFGDLNGTLRAIDWTKVQQPLEKAARRFRLQMFLWGFEKKPPILKGTVWRFRHPRESFQGTPTIVKGAVYIPTSVGSVYKVSASNGKPVWKYESGSRLTQSVTVKEGIAYVGDISGKIHGISTETGELVWEFFVEGKVTSPVVFAEGTLFVTTNNYGQGRLYALR